MLFALIFLPNFSIIIKTQSIPQNRRMENLHQVMENPVRMNHTTFPVIIAAAIAFVCSLTGVPLLLVKSVTDLCDGGEKTYDEFRRNLSAASHALRDANLSIVRYLSRSKLICRTSRS